MQHKGRLAIAIVLLLTLATPLQAATPKAGTKCTKAGATATASGKKFTCIKSGSKLVWNKGVALSGLGRFQQTLHGRGQKFGLYPQSVRKCEWL